MAKTKRMEHVSDVRPLPLLRRIILGMEWRRKLVRERAKLWQVRLVLELRWWGRRQGKPHGLPGPLIVSLTSFPPRFGTLHLTLRCLLTQTVRSDRVILWLAHGDVAQLPKEVLTLKKSGLEIRPTTDIRPYKKIIPALREFPDAFIVTADDDVYYRRRCLEELVSGWDGRPNLITCHRAHRVTGDSRGFPRPYRDWDHDTARRAEGIDLFPTGACGVLYPPGSLAPEVLDEATFLAICPQNDDIWLYWMGRRAGATYRRVTDRREECVWPGSQEVGLYQYNGVHGGNDIQIGAMVRRYGWPNSSDAAASDRDTTQFATAAAEQTR